MSNDILRLTTTVSVRSHPPGIPEINWEEGADTPDVQWFDRDGNPIPEDRSWGGLFLRYEVPVMLRKEDVLYVVPEWDDMTQYVGDEPKHTKIALRGFSSYTHLEVTEDINTVLRLLGWPEIDLPRGFQRERQKGVPIGS